MNQGGPSAATIERPLISRVLSVPAYRVRYEELLDELVDDRFSETTVSADIDRWAELITEHVYADPTKLSTFDNFLSDVDQGSPQALGLRAFVSRRNEYVRAALAGEVEIVCGDGICDPGETCTEDCTTTNECPPCAVFNGDRCSPSCADSCTCPTDLPVTFTCEPTGMCVPEAPACGCGPDQVCTPNGRCVPRCTADPDCPTFAPLCEPTSGLCHW